MVPASPRGARVTNPEQVAAIVDRCEQALAAGGPVDLRGCGFWRAVRAVERHPNWIDRFANRLAAIDRQAYERSPLLKLPLRRGVGALTAGALLGAALVGLSGARPRHERGWAILAGTALVLGATHDLAHFLVGRWCGIGFLGLYLGGPIPFEPGLKVDYASYLRVPPRQRALMHASGAVTTKLVPFAVLAATDREAYPTWVRTVLLGIGVLQVITDLLFSTRYSDWRRFAQQWRLAQQSAL